VLLLYSKPVLLTYSSKPVLLAYSYKRVLLRSIWPVNSSNEESLYKLELAPYPKEVVFDKL
jgi:hypothetical protein